MTYFLRGRWLLLSLTLLALVGSAAAQSGTTLGERGYDIYVPSTAEDDQQLPLIIALHGMGGDKDSFAALSGLVQTGEAFGFITAFPNGYLNQWNDGSQGDHYEDDLALLLELIEVVDAEHPVDRDRVYIAGFSNGGTMAFRAACETNGVFAGIASVAGAMRTLQDCEGAEPLSVLIMHGTGDRVVPFAGAAYRYSAPQATQLWHEINGCSDADMPEYDPALFTNGTAIYYYDECASQRQVMLYALEAVSHTWPGARSYLRGQRPPRPIDTAAIIWGFFELAHQAQQAESD